MNDEALIQGGDIRRICRVSAIIPVMFHATKIRLYPNAAQHDDTTDARVGRHLENVSYIFDHVVGKTRLGFKDLILGYFDGTSFTPLDFSVHAEKALRGKARKAQYKKTGVPGSPGNRRRQECSVDKITQAITMVKRAIKHGFRAKYVLTGSWFSSKGFIQAMRQI